MLYLSGTTRLCKPGETNGVDYHFLTLEQFAALEKGGHLLESGIFDGRQHLLVCVLVPSSVE